VPLFTEIFGSANTATETVRVLLQLPVPVPVTEYTEVDAGDTDNTWVPVVPFHVYVLAPLAVRLSELPAHNVGDAGVMDNTGNAYTVNVRAADAVHPELLVPVTEYTDVTDGEIATETEVDPMLQLYVFAPLALRVPDCPAHTALLPDTEITGRELTVMVRTAVFEQVPDAPITVYEVVTDGVEI
jgi:hypothetical protein